MAQRTEYVQRGIWGDYDQPGWSAYQVLVTDETAQVMSNSIAVAMTLTLPRLLRIFKLFLPKKAKPESPQEQNGNSLERVSNRELEPVQRDSPHRSAADSGPNIEEEPEEEHDEIGTEQVRPDQSPLTALPVPRPAFFRMPRFSSRITSGLFDILYDSRSPEEAAAQIARHHLAMPTISTDEIGQTRISFLKRCSQVLRNLKEDTWSFALISALVIMLFGIFIGEQVVAISVAGIISGSIGLSTSPKCGNFIYPKDDLQGIWNFQSSALAAAQQRATSYVDNCYGEATIPESCNIYYNATISYSEEHNASCPFLGEVCLYGQTSAYTLDTQFVDSNVLGINAPTRYQFRRRTTCSPLVMNSSYIQYWYPKNRTDLSPMASYAYGNSETDSWTITQPVDFSFGQIQYAHSNGYYHFRTHGTSLYGAPENRNILRAEFQPLASDVSLLFIRPRAFKYSTPSDDPIFPADAMVENEQTYYNSLPHATVLGCVDKAEIRHPETFQKWTPRNFTSWRTPSPEWRANPLENLFLLLGLGLDVSNTWNAVNYGVSLDAERKIIHPGGTSLPLAREQWKVESRRFFEISLALLQGKIYDIARGTYADVAGVRSTFEEVNQPICSMVKIPTVGWTNISLFWLVTLPTFAFLLWFTSIEVSGKLILVWFYQILLEPWLSPILGPVLKASLFVLKWMVDKIPRLFSCLWRNTIYPGGLSWVLGKIMTAYHNHSDRIRRMRYRSAEGHAFELWN